MLVLLDIKFRVSNIKWNLCQNTVKSQNMASLLVKMYTNIALQTKFVLT